MILENACLEIERGMHKYVKKNLKTLIVWSQFQKLKELFIFITRSPVHKIAKPHPPPLAFGCYGVRARGLL